MWQLTHKSVMQDRIPGRYLKHTYFHDTPIHRCNVPHNKIERRYKHNMLCLFIGNVTCPQRHPRCTYVCMYVCIYESVREFS